MIGRISRISVIGTACPDQLEVGQHDRNSTMDAIVMIVARRLFDAPDQSDITLADGIPGPRTGDWAGGRLNGTNAGYARAG